MWISKKRLKQMARDAYTKGWGDGYTAKFEAINRKTAITGMRWEQELEEILKGWRR